ncbi:MAG: 50S ribosomal protein L24 [Parcubacteria group bacterium ADurb.Bin159]|jgi:large subunit ribosomal protein L24|nr:MAG: 50S ribosomal protein L24 [Parcubacteria group bacterium ADurb.Bin159]
MKIKKNDQILIIRGKDKNKKGKVIRVLPKEQKIVIENLNLISRHVKPKKEGEKGQIIKIARPIPASNVILICPNCHQPVRVGYKILPNKKKQRWCRKCKELIS